MSAMLLTEPKGATMRRKIMCPVLYAFLVIVLAQTTLFAQQEKNIKSYRPPQRTLPYSRPMPEAELINKAQLGKETIKMDYLMQYAAVREEDLSACDQATSPDECKKSAEFSLAMKYMANGTCEKIKKKYFREICLALSKNDCPSLGEGKSDICEGYRTQDISLMEKGFSKEVAKGSGVKPKKDAISAMMAVYAGFKFYNSKMACEKFTQGLALKNKIACSALFDTGDTQQVLDDLSRDMAYFSLTKEYGEKKICEQIKDKELRKICLSNNTEKIW